MNLGETKGTNIKEFEAKAGSEVMMDFNNGDPLANTDINDMHMKKGASIDFSGSTGEQELGVMDRFSEGSYKRANAALATGDVDAIGEATDDRWATQDIRSKSLDKHFEEAGYAILLI